MQLKKLILSLCCIGFISPVLATTTDGIVSVTENNQPVYNSTNNQWILYGETVLLDGTTSSNTWDASVYTFGGSNTVDVKGAGAKWTSFAMVGNNSNLTVNLSDNAIWSDATLVVFKGNLTLNVDNAKLYTVGTSLTQGGADGFKRIINNIDYKNTRLFALASGRLEKAIQDVANMSWFGDFATELAIFQKLKTGTATEQEWKTFQSSMATNAWILSLMDSSNPLVVSSITNNLNLTNNGILDLSIRGNTPAGLVVDNFTSDNGMVILNSDWSDQSLIIASSASGNVIIQDVGNTEGRGMLGSNPLIYYMGSDTPTLTINNGELVMEKGLYAYNVEYISDNSGLAGYFYRPVRLSNTALAAKAVTLSSVLMPSLYRDFMQDRPQQLRTNPNDEGSLYIKPLHQSQSVNTQYSDVKVRDNGIVFGMDKVFQNGENKLLVGASIFVTKSKLNDDFSRSDARSYGVNAYLSQIYANGLFADLHIFGNYSYKNMYVTPIGLSASYHGKYRVKGGGIATKVGYNYEHNRLFAMPYIGVSTYRDEPSSYNLGTTRIINRGLSLSYINIGTRLGLTFDNLLSDSITFRPYVDVAYNGHIKNKNNIVFGGEVIDARSIANALDSTYFGIGTQLDIAKKVAISVNIERTYGRHITGTSMKFNLNYFW